MNVWCAFVPPLYVSSYFMQHEHLRNMELRFSYHYDLAIE